MSHTAIIVTTAALSLITHGNAAIEGRLSNPRYLHLINAWAAKHTADGLMILWENGYLGWDELKQAAWVLDGCFRFLQAALNSNSYLPLTQEQAFAMGPVPLPPNKGKGKGKEGKAQTTAAEEALCLDATVHGCRNGVILKAMQEIDAAELEWREFRAALATAQSRAYRLANTLPAEQDYAARLDGFISEHPLPPPNDGW